MYGAGAIGGYLGAELALAGADVTLIARGPHPQAIPKKGLKSISGGKERIVRPRRTDGPAQAGPQDYVFATLKAHSVPAVAGGWDPATRGPVQPPWDSTHS